MQELSLASFRDFIQSICAGDEDVSGDRYVSGEVTGKRCSAILQCDVLLDFYTG